MKQNLVALVSGTLFGLGLSVSQMINPVKVLGFLNIAGPWDPSLALVMGSALIVMIPAWRWQARRSGGTSVLKSTPDLDDVDAPLIVGAAIFGAGWGLVGYCPGPALAALSTFDLKPLIFVAAMLAGMVLHHLLFNAQLQPERA